MALTIESSLPLANSTYKIPRLGFGVYLSPPPTCVKSCLKAVEAGYRHIDTAQYYENEKEVGHAREESKVPRSELFLTSKILTPAKDIESTYRTILGSVEKLDGPNGYVDLFLVHSPNGGAEARKLMWQALEQAKEKGVLRDIGVSNYGIQHIEEIKSLGSVWPPVVNQIEVCFCLSIQLCASRTGLIKTSSILGANNAKLLNIARITKSSLKPTVPWFATRSRTIRLCLASARNTT